MMDLAGRRRGLRSGGNALSAQGVHMPFLCRVSGSDLVSSPRAQEASICLADPTSHFRIFPYCFPVVLLGAALMISYLVSTTDTCFVTFGFLMLKFQKQN